MCVFNSFFNLKLFEAHKYCWKLKNVNFKLFFLKNFVSLPNCRIPLPWFPSVLLICPIPLWILQYTITLYNSSPKYKIYKQLEKFILGVSYDCTQILCLCTLVSMFCTIYATTGCKKIFSQIYNSCLPW